jgi:uncharacterized membrane protein YphA (DoxX/SURF4 family)
VAKALPWFGFGVRLAAAAIWLAAGLSKLADLQGFDAEVHAYQGCRRSRS